MAIRHSAGEEPGVPLKRAAFAYLRDRFREVELVTSRATAPALDNPIEIGEALASSLDDAAWFGLARRVVRKARRFVPEDTKDPVHGEKLSSLLLWEARLTCRDADLPRAYRVTRGWELVKRAASRDGGLASTRNRRVLLEAASVCKRRWEHDATTDELELCLQFYEGVMKLLSEEVDGYVEVERGPYGVVARWTAKQVDGQDAKVLSPNPRLSALRDFQQAAINIAFVSDLLANQLRKIPRVSAAQGMPRRIESLCKTAEDSRRALIAAFAREQVSSDVCTSESARASWWRMVTLAEAHLGLGETALAMEHFSGAWTVHRQWQTPRWWSEIAVRQAATLSAILPVPTDPAVAADQAASRARAIGRLIGVEADDLPTTPGSRVGLALSGGGFRAAFFHLGVLACLAEWDLLRSVEVISCVSGGATVGAMLQLHLRRRLQESKDPIPQDEYIRIVEGLIQEFLSGVQRNIRARLLSNPIAILRMLLPTGWTRSHQLARLYDKHLLLRVAERPRWDKSMTTDLLVRPFGVGSDAKELPARSENFARRSKIPMLVLSATTLNTGHAWHFTGTWMGEPPGSVDPESNASERLRRVHYADAPTRYVAGVPLAECVAASSAVPGAFPPMPLRRLYPGRTVYLTDGGLRDNQGFEALLDQECSHIIASDGSGQIDAESDPASSVFATLSRSSQIAQARVRESQIERLRALEASGVIQNYTIVHLRGGIPVHTIDWNGCEEPADEVREARSESPEVLPPQIQEAAAKIRTDLDAFNDLESDTLMYAGYESMHASLDRRPIQAHMIPARHMWEFEHVAARIADPLRCDQLLAILRRGRHRFFRWMRDPVIALTLVVAVAAVAIVLRAAIGATCVGCWSFVRAVPRWLFSEGTDSACESKEHPPADSTSASSPPRTVRPDSDGAGVAAASIIPRPMHHDIGGWIVRSLCALPIVVIVIVWLVRRVRQFFGLPPPHAGYLEYLVLATALVTGFWLLVHVYLWTIDRVLLWKYSRARS